MGDFDPFIHYSKNDNIVPLSLTKLIRVSFELFILLLSFKKI